MENRPPSPSRFADSTSNGSSQHQRCSALSVEYVSIIVYVCTFHFYKETHTVFRSVNPYYICLSG